MSEHVDPETLRLFSEGELSQDHSVVVALHLDACHHCLGRVEQMDPFAEEFRSMPEPRVPEGLAHAAVMQARQSASIARADVFVGVGLLVAAALLLVVAGDPVPVGVQLSVLTRAAWAAAGHLLGSTLILSGGLLASTAVACGLAAFALRFNRSGQLA
ncbi:MAG: putative anti-sigma-YlaC factor YlaD [Myxococcota bacterium]|jgi:predicted anti-sigma-YlaC factor YlaD